MRAISSLAVLFVGLVLLTSMRGHSTIAEPPADAGKEYAAEVRPLLQKYCLGCHSTKSKKGSLDLERFASIDDVRKHVKPWQQAIEMLEAGEMPPKDKPQPTAAEHTQIIAWIHSFLDAEAKAVEARIKAAKPEPRNAAIDFPAAAN